MQTFKIRRFRDRDLSLTFDQTVKIQKSEALWISLYEFSLGHDQLVFQLVKIQLVTVSVSDVSVSDEFS